VSDGNSRTLGRVLDLLTESDIRAEWEYLLGDKAIPGEKPNSRGGVKCWALGREKGNAPSAEFFLDGGYKDYAREEVLDLVQAMSRYGDLGLDEAGICRYLRTKYDPQSVVNQKPERKPQSGNGHAEHPRPGPATKPTTKPKEPKPAGRPMVTRVYPYVDESGELLYEAVRYIPKEFRQRRPDGRGGHIWNLGDVRRVLYLLPALLAADPSLPVYICEGEKDCETVRDMGFVSTTNCGGAKSWRPEYADSLRGRHCVLLPHNDEAGEAQVLKVTNSLDGVAASIKVLRLPNLPTGGGDATDWKEAGGTPDELRQLTEECGLWSPREPGDESENETSNIQPSTNLSSGVRTVEVGTLAAIVGGVRPDGVSESLFSAEEHRSIYRLIEKHWVAYKQSPSVTTVRVLVDESRTPEAEKELIRAALDQIKARVEDREATATSDFRFNVALLVDRHKRSVAMAHLASLQAKIKNGADLSEVGGIRVADAWKGFSDDLSDGPQPFSQQLDAFKSLNESIIDNLARRGEVANIISGSKIGKTWLLHGMALCVATGRDWMGHRIGRPRNALIIDNELHPSTLTWRIREVAGAMGLQREDYEHRLRTMAVRGKGVDVTHLPKLAGSGALWRPDWVGLDSLYRFLPPGTNENDNGAMKDVYEQIIAFTDSSECVTCVVGHSSKGDQSERAVTDVGSGAGSIARAADCHIVLRQHKEDDCAVMEARVRSYAMPEPKVLRWNFPIWVEDPDLNPKDLRSARQKQQDDADEELVREAEDAIRGIIREQKLATVGAIRSSTGWRKDKAERVIGKAIKAGTLIKVADGENVHFRLDPEVLGDF
jgi:hypothetical protein